MNVKYAQLDRYRVKRGQWASPEGKTYGAFVVPFKTVELTIIADDGEHTGWEHVSVSLPNRCPNWAEMCFVKDLFWSDDETVVQFHPRKSEHVNIHPNCLHLWKARGVEFQLPPKVCV